MQMAKEYLGKVFATNVKELADNQREIQAQLNDVVEIDAVVHMVSRVLDLPRVSVGE